MSSANDILKKYWGFDNFRPTQDKIVDASIYGHDVLALLPTGGGKSICFQVPGLLRDGLCLVVSPLIALMQDQVKNLQSRGIRAQALMGGMSIREIDILLDNAKFGGFDFLYTSPERLKSKLFIERCKQMNLGLIVIDEAHCISEWGHDFRPAYREIAELREWHPDVPMIALTATATVATREDIKEQLKLKNPHYFENSFVRDNISYEVVQTPNKTQALLQIVERFKGDTGIIYCNTRKGTKDIMRLLQEKKVSSTLYHGGLNQKERDLRLEYWMHDKVKIMVATNAFGMGIDKPDVRFVVHFDTPETIEAYFQEAGRAGRDGKLSRTFLLTNKTDVDTLEQRVEQKFPSLDEVKRTYRALCNFLRIAIGAGDQESYEFNLREFIKKFEFNPISAYNSLKILELNEDIVLNESAHHPTRLKFSIGNTALYSFQIKYDRFSNLITLLSRSYPGIFTNFYQIDEVEVAKRLKISVPQVSKLLKQLEEQGVIDIQWQTDDPIVTLLHERLPDDYLNIATKVYHQRKKVAFEKMAAMKNFIESKTCRSQLLLAYFDQESEACGSCDVCKMETELTYSFEELVENAKTILQQPKSMVAFKNEIGIQSKKVIEPLINWLFSQELIVQTEDDKLKMK